MALPGAQIVISAIDRTKAAFSSVKESLFGTQKAAESVGKQFNGIFSRLGLQIGAFFSVKSLAGQIDEFNNLQARLKLVSRNTEEYTQAQQDLKRISEESKSPLAETATLYTRIAGSVKDLNVSQADIADTTEAVALGLRISGATAAESSSAMLQFSQAIASGVLRGEEFNAVNESAPRIMQALAKSLEVPVGKLREMAKEGKLTRDVIIDGLLKQLPTLREESASLPNTIGNAFTALKNKLLLTAGAFDQVSGASNGVAKAITGIGTKGIEALAIVGANVAFVFNAMGREIGAIAAQMGALLRLDFKSFKFIGDAVKEDARLARAELDAFEKRVLEGDARVAKARQESARETRRKVQEITEEEKKEWLKSVDEKIKDQERLTKNIRDSFSEALKIEKDYLREARRLRAEASQGEVDPNDIEAQASAKLDAVIAVQKLQRISPTAGLDDVREQADLVRDLAGRFEDAALKADLLKRANLAEAAALEKAAATERERAAGLANQQTLADSRIANMKDQLQILEKGAVVEIKIGESITETEAALDRIAGKLAAINNWKDVVGGSSSTSSGLPNLTDATLKRGVRP